MPLGVIIHGSRSTLDYNELQEFAGTVRYAGKGAEGLYWSVTLGPDKVCIHGDIARWGWNAKQHSRDYLAAEFSQSKEGGLVSDSQFDAFAWWYKNEALVKYPSLPRVFIMHSELPAGIADGKTDLVRIAQANEIRARINAALERIEG